MVFFFDAETPGYTVYMVRLLTFGGGSLVSPASGVLHCARREKTSLRTKV